MSSPNWLVNINKTGEIDLAITYKHDLAGYWKVIIGLTTSLLVIWFLASQSRMIF